MVNRGYCETKAHGLPDTSDGDDAMRRRFWFCCGIRILDYLRISAVSVYQNLGTKYCNKLDYCVELVRCDLAEDGCLGSQ